VLESGGYFKIGIAVDVPRRIAAITGSCPSPVTLLFSASVPNARYIEKLLHTKYAEQNTHHEWFKLTPEQVNDVKTYLTPL